jgi:uncharacterized membrane protein YcfT
MMPGLPESKRVPISELSVGAIILHVLIFLIAAFIIGIVIGQGLQNGLRTSEWLTVISVGTIPIYVLWGATRELWRRSHELKTKQNDNDDDI